MSTRFVSSLLLILAVGLCHGCAESQGAPGSAGDAPDAPGHVNVDGELDQVAAEVALAPDTPGTAITLPTDSPALLGHVSAAATMTSPHFQLRLSVGAPVARARRSGPSYQLHLAAPWPPAPQETP